MSRSFHVAAFIVLGLTTAACGMENALVGGSCKPGYVEYGGSCVVAPSGTSPDFGSPDTTSPTPDRTGQTPSALTPGRAVFEPPPPIRPNTPPVDPPVDLPVDPPVDPPILVCADPLVACRGECISVESDPLNCGACGRICPSNICTAGECVGATPGDVVLIGHDMSGALSGSSQSKVLTNAVSIPTTDPIRVLSYEAGADAQTAAHVRALLGGGIRNRNVVFTAASAEAVAADGLYASYDVVLIHGAAGPDPTELGQQWRSSLMTFTGKGGVVVALDSGASDVPALVSSAHLLQVTGHLPLGGSTKFVVSSASDVVGAQVLSPYAAFGASVGFLGAPEPDPDLTWVVRTDDGASLPTVIHRVVRFLP